MNIFINIMNILIVGSGGREHSICKKLSNSKCNLFYYGTHDNPGMSKLAEILDIGPLNNIGTIVKLCLKHKIDMVVIGPETPLFYGLADILLKNNIQVVGPTKDLALIETSKYFARKLMFDNNLGQYCPKLLYVIHSHEGFYEGFNEELDNKLKTIMGSYEVVLKPDSISGGKGVYVQHDHFTTREEIVNYCEYVTTMQKQTVIIEEKLVGEEFSIMSFCDGVTLKHMIPVKDYKRLYDNDCGSNTGSMGSLTGYDGQLWFLNENDIKICHTINEQIIKLLQKNFSGQLYKGILYGSFMKTNKKEVKVIEFNARFGDPECINILELLENDLLDVFKAICDQQLDKINLVFRKDASIFKYKIPEGYPEMGLKGEIIKFNTNPLIDDNLICASMSKSDNKYITLGSRTFGIIHVGEDIAKVCLEINKRLDDIENKLFYRKDVGSNLSISYKDSGVNIEEKEHAIREITKDITSTYNDNVFSRVGDFCGLMRFQNKILVSSVDGIGTKSRLVLECYGYEKGFEMLGRDLVNLNMNDILVKMAHPLFFLDYFGCNRLDANHLKHFVKGITEACNEIGSVLIKGETAQMVDIYNENTFDLVGCIIGYSDEIIDGKKLICDGDIVIGLPSNGPHTNGFSLIRKILDRLKPYEDISQDIIDCLCAPHKSYYRDVFKLKQQGLDIHGLIHITGGGLNNVPRVLPDGYMIKYYNLELPKVFKFLQYKSHLSDHQMRHIFNCGIGYMIIIPRDDLSKINDIEYIVVGEVLPIQSDIIF